MGHYGKWHLGILDLAHYGFHVSGITTGSIYRNYRYDFNNSTEAIIDKGIAFLKANKDKPFYLQLWTFAPHAPLEPSKKQMSFFDNLIIKRLQDKFTSPAQVYYSVIRDLDYHLGRLFRALELHGLQDNTMVIFASDNGPEDINILEAAHSGAGSTGPFRGRKRSLYEGGIRTPFIVWCPAKVPSGRIDNKTVISGVDLLPTLCNFANINIPEQMNLDGDDMSEALRGKDKMRSKPLMWEQRFQVFGPQINQSPMLAVREEHWKLLMNPDKSRIELYDIIKDPMEVDNLANNNPDVVARLSKTLLAWSKELPKGPVDEKAGAAIYPWPGKNTK
jgi:arylsulfatase A-like enzyme